MKKNYRAFLLILSALLLPGCTKRETQAEPGQTKSEEEIPAETAASYPVGRLGDAYILPDVKEHVYTAEELSQLTAGELRIARNEIYARYGRIFQSDDLNRYFKGRVWYQGTVAADHFDPDILNQNEKDNLKVILKMEEAVPVCTIPKIGRSEFPRVNGSTATLPITQAMYRMATGATQQEAETAVTHGKTSYAWRSLTYSRSSRTADLIIAYEPPESFEQMRQEAGQEIIVRPIGRDALVFLVNESNPVKSLTQQQIFDIYSGTITNWRGVGGKDSKIRAFQRPEDSGSQNLMDKLVMKGRRMAVAPTHMVASDMGDLIERVSSFNGTGDAFGYSVYYYARNMYQKPELSFIAVDNVMPSVDTIRDGSYPFVNDFYAAIRADEPRDSKAYQLFEWLTGEDGQSLLNGLGYVGITEADKSLPAQLSLPQEDFTGSIPLPEDYVILASGQYLYDEIGIAVFDSQMRLRSFYSNVESGSVDNFMECPWDIEIDAWDTINETAGRFSIADGRWAGVARPDQDVQWDEDAGEEYFSSDELARMYAADHPEQLARYGVTEEAVSLQYYHEESPQIVEIDDGSVLHYYSVNGRFLLDLDKGDKYSADAGEYGHYSRVWIADDRTACLDLADTYRIYRDGVLIKELNNENISLADVSSNFYVIERGNYLYVYNYQDELCGRFLEGQYGND